MLGVVAHDAGGAEILSSYLRRQRLDWVCALEGPARRIFERKLGLLAVRPLEEVVERSSFVLCSTSWQSDLEFRAIKLARSLGKRSAAFLDHWICYRERFVRSGEMCLPDEIWVADTMAEALARDTFPAMPISVVGNPYLDDVRQELMDITSTRSIASSGLLVLYICEPLREQAMLQYGDERYWGYVEEDALRYCLAGMPVIAGSIGQITIRPHPAEPADKYAWVRREFDLPIAIGGSQPLLNEIADSDIVAGCESMAMVVGLIAGKRVISCIPPAGKPCSLPHRGIESLQSLLLSRRVSQ